MMCAVKRWALAVVVMSLFALGACDSGGGDDKKTTSNPGAAALGGQVTKPGKLPDPHYVVFPDKTPGTGWTLTESLRETGTGRNAALGGLPGLDWYSEFDGPDVGGEKSYLSLTGYAQSLDDRRADLVDEGTTAQDGDINGHKAFWVTDPSDSQEGVTITYEVAENYTIEVFGTGVTLDQLLAFARTVKDASESEWKAAGGKTSDCEDDDCPDSADG